MNSCHLVLQGDTLAGRYFSSVLRVWNASALCIQLCSSNYVCCLAGLAEAPRPGGEVLDEACGHEGRHDVRERAILVVEHEAVHAEALVVPAMQISISSKERSE